jgi:hypothetical protein
LIINHTHGFIFVHVPKAAGTTVTHELSQLTTYRDLELGGTAFGEAIAPIYRKRFQLRKHSTAREILLVVRPEVWNSVFTFAFVKSVCSRVLHLSVLAWMEGMARLGGMEKHESFQSLVQSKFYESDGPDRILRPQSIWVQDQEGQLLTTFVGRVENLQADLAHAFTKFGVQSWGEAIGRRNQSTKEGEWRRLYDRPETTARVVERYCVELRAFGYEPKLI